MVYSLFELSIPLSKVVEMIVYILQIDPSHWTVFTNTPSYDKDFYDTQKKNLLTRIYSAYFLEESIDPEVHGSVNTIIDLLKQCDEWGVTQAETAKTKPIYPNHKQCPRFFHERTNVAESVASKFLKIGFRSQIPPLSVPTFLDEYNKMALEAVNEIEKCFL